MVAGVLVAHAGAVGGVVVYGVIQKTVVVKGAIVTVVSKVPPGIGTSRADLNVLSSWAWRISPAADAVNGSGSELTGARWRSAGAQNAASGSAAGPPAAVKLLENVASIWNWYQLMIGQEMPAIE
jgi:hypothetical protein